MKVKGPVSVMIMERHVYGIISDMTGEDLVETSAALVDRTRVDLYNLGTETNEELAADKGNAVVTPIIDVGYRRR
jgi:hypothetical protein